MLGFPYKEQEPGEPVQAIRTLATVTKLATLPEGMLVDDELLRVIDYYFVGQLGQSANSSIEGMSGGPIFGFRFKDGVAHYWIVALQSSWFGKRKVTLGCSVPFFASFIDGAIIESEKAEAGGSAEVSALQRGNSADSQ